MADEPKIDPLNELVKQFQALKTHDERVAFFQAHPELGRIFHPVHFQPKPTS